jgi:GLPGLI family protein
VIKFMRIIGIFTGLLSLSLFASSVCAQETFKYESSSSEQKKYTYYEGEYYLDPKVSFFSVSQRDSVVLDKARLRVMYEARIVRDTTTRVRLKDRMITLIGNNWYKTFGDMGWRLNMRSTVADSLVHKYYRPDGYNIVLSFQMYRNLKARTIRNVTMLPYMVNGRTIYTESQPVFKWKLRDSVKSIEGYSCQMAETEYAGRVWTAWFTPEISVDCGFWKFSGLPGLILEASDKSGDYSFMVSSIENTEEPISLYRTDNKEISRKESRALEKDVYAHPSRYSPDPDVDELITTDTRTFAIKPDQLVFPYNPMELK